MHETVDIHLTSSQPKDYGIFYESSLFHNKTITATGRMLRLAIQRGVFVLFERQVSNKAIESIFILCFVLHVFVFDSFSN